MNDLDLKGQIDCGCELRDEGLGDCGGKGYGWDGDGDGMGGEFGDGWLYPFWWLVERMC